MSMQEVAAWAGSACGWVAVGVGLYSAYLWALASKARVNFRIGERQVMGGGNLAVEITKDGVINPDATARLSNKLNAKAAMLTAGAIGLQAIGGLLSKVH